jgi:starch phosphorylase
VESPVISKLLDQYGCGPVHFEGIRDALYQRHLLFDDVVLPGLVPSEMHIVEQNFLFGLTADHVADSRSWYNPRWHYDNEAETRAALDLMFSDYLSRNEPGVFEPLRETLLIGGDYYMHLADLKSYVQAQERLGDLHTNQDAWAQKVVLNVASSGKFLSDRTIAEYAADIWGVSPCPVL